MGRIKNLPIVGIVLTVSPPSFILYKMVVLPAASSPSIKIRASFKDASLRSESKSPDRAIPIPIEHTKPHVLGNSRL